MAKTYKVLVTGGKDAAAKAVPVQQGTGDKGNPLRLVSVRGARYELQDDAKGKGLGPDEVRVKRVGKNLWVMFVGSQTPDVVIEGFYEAGKAGDDGAPTLVGLAENNNFYEYVPQDPEVSSLTAALSDGGMPVAMSLGGGAVGGEFVLSALPLVAAAAGGIGGLAIAGGALLVAAAAGGGGGGAAAKTAPTGQTGALTHDAANDTGASTTDSITNNQNPVFSGVAEKGATVEVTVNGVTYTTTASATDGTYSVPLLNGGAPLSEGTYKPTIKVSNSAGSTTVDGTPFTVDRSTFVEPIRTDPFNPAVANKSGLRVVIDTDANNDGVINGKTELASDQRVNATVWLTKDSVKDDVITVTITVDGVVKEVRTVMLTAQQVSDGKVTLLALSNPAEGSNINVAASIKDVAGNTSPSPDANDGAVYSTSISTVAIVADANNDGFINSKELAGASTLSLKTDVAAGAKPNDVVKVVLTITALDGTKTTQEFTHTLSSADITKGYVTDTFTKPAEGSTIEAAATLNNLGEGRDKAVLDTSTFTEPYPADPFNPVDPSKPKTGLRVSIDTDKNNDGIINTPELAATGGKVAVVITLSQDAAVGDLVTFAATGNAQRTVFVTQAHIDAGRQIKFDDVIAPADGSAITVEASIKDKAGNTSVIPNATDSATFSTTIPTVTITNDANNDGFINASEYPTNAQATVRVDIPVNAKVGDVITVIGNGVSKPHVLTADDLSAGTFTETFAAPSDGGKLTVTATHKSAAGAVSGVGRDEALVDTSKFKDPLDPSKPSLSVRIDTDGDNDGFINNAELLATNQRVKATITLGADAAVGDIVTIKADNNADRTILLTAADISAKQIVIIDLASPGEGKTITVRASIKDKAGNGSVVDATATATVDTVGPKPSDPVVDPEKDVKLEITSVATDNVLNDAEKVGKVTVVGKVTGEYQVGDVVTITLMDNNSAKHTYTATVDKDGNFTVIDVLGQDLAGDADLTVQATLIAHDQAKNASTVTASRTYLIADPANGGVKPDVLIEQDTNDNGFLDGNEALANGKLTVRVSFIAAKVKAGDKVVLSDGQVITLSETQAQAGFVEFNNVAPPTDGKTLAIKAYIETPAGNKSPEGTDAISLDSNVASQASISISSITEDKGTANDFITSDSHLIYSGTLSNFANNGAKVKLLLHKADGSVTDVSDFVSISNFDAAKKTATWSWNREAVDQADGTYTLTATLVNAAGIEIPSPNATAQKEITISEDALNAQNDAVNVFENGGFNNQTQGGSPAGHLNVLANDSTLNSSITKAAVAQNNTQTKYGTFTLKIDGTYAYVLNQSDAKVQALRNDKDTLTDTIEYTVVDSAGQTKKANLVVTVVGKNDMPEFTGVSTVSVTNTATSASGPHSLLFTDPDTGESTFKEPAQKVGAYGDFRFDSTANTWSYKVDGTRAAGLTAGFRAYDVVTVQSFDGSVTQTLQVEVKPSGATTGTPQIFNLLNTDRMTLAGDWLSTEIDTLVLGGSNMTLDLTAATTKITHIEQIDLGADASGANTPNTLTLNLDSLLQSDSHKLTVFGGAADTVNFSGAVQTSHTTVTVNGVVFTDYHYTTTVNNAQVELDLLVQQGIVLGAIS